MFPNLPEISGFLPAKCPAKSRNSLQLRRDCHRSPQYRVFFFGASRGAISLYPRARPPVDRGVQTGRGFPIWTFLSLFVLFWDFPDFSGILMSLSRILPIGPFLLLGLLIPFKAPTRNISERVSNTRKKVGNPPVWKPPGLLSTSRRATTIAEAHI